MAEEPYQALYRRFRPQRFDEVRGQDHVTRALSNAVRQGRAGHAYLFSGPRGTGKTSTARILAKALNCASVQNGEPCGVCPSCAAVQAGSSLDVHELDAASNNGVEAIRDLVARAALGTPGRWKVYIVDEVHMLTAAASATLLKTLEEPPGHVVFVLATTDPQKVLPTIRSRTQHFEFHLLGTDVICALLNEVNERAGLGLDQTTLETASRRGNGSARDALSALDQAAAGGGLQAGGDSAAAIVDGLCQRDPAAVLVAVAQGMQLGRDAQRLAVDVVEHLRAGFLGALAPGLLPTADVALELREVAVAQAGRLGLPTLVRAMEILGEALVDMRDALDTRVTLELALLRVCAPEADSSLAALVERVDRLERRLASPPPPPAPPPPSTDGAPGPGPSVEPPTSKPTIGAFKRDERPARPAVTNPPEPAPPTGRGSGLVPTRDILTKVWGDGLLAALAPGARSVYGMGRWAQGTDGQPVFALPSRMYRELAESKRAEVEAALSAHFGQRVPVRLVYEDTDPVGVASPLTVPLSVPPEPLPEPPGEPPGEQNMTATEVAGLEPAHVQPTSIEARLIEAFPGAEEVST